jgi:heavy metal efflux system protein
MIDRILAFSIQHRYIVVLLALVLVGVGVWSAVHLPIDAVPDVTTKQVQVNTVAPALSPLEVERQITFPMEVALSGLPRLQGLRSISQFGLSQVTAVFEDDVDIYFARQLVMERLQGAKEQLPPGIDTPRMAPISSGLGEIYYVLVENDRQSLMERRATLDWMVKPQLRTVPGIIEVNSYGGEEKQYQVLVDPQKLQAHGLTMRQVQESLERNNANAGGGYLKRGREQQLVRGIGVIRNTEDIRNIVVDAEDGTPITIRDIAQVAIGPAIRQGALTKDGQGEAVAGITMLLLGENSRTVVKRVKDRVVEIQKSMPPGVKLTPFMDRSVLVDKTLHTASRNLIEGGVLVILVLFLFLLQFQAGLIVSSAIPLAMLFAIIGMKYYGVSANLMSLGAIDFGLIVDGSVIIVENCVRRLAEERHRLGRTLTKEERLQVIRRGTTEVRQATQFGEMIIIAAYIPILSLVGIEGKMFRPMGFTVIMALIAAMVLSFTLIPALCGLFLKVEHDRENPVVAWLQRLYRPLLGKAMRHRYATVASALVFVALGLSLFPKLGSEFLPELDEGALAIQTSHLPSISLDEAVHRATLVERLLKQKFPHEIDTVVTRIGRPEIATDPMLLSQHDALVSLHPRERWRAARTKDELVERIAAELKKIPGMNVSFTQPIRMRMMELTEGVGIRADLGVKLFGPDMAVLQQKGTQIEEILKQIPGGADVSTEQTAGLPVLEIDIRRDQIARYGINVRDVHDVVEAAIGGRTAGEVIVGNARFDLTLRFAAAYREDAEAIGRILVSAPGGERIPLERLAEIRSVEGPVQVSRENGERRVVIQANVRGRDLGSYTEEAKARVAQQVKLPPGYHIHWGGQYEHLVSGRARLMVVVPITFFVIFLLLFMTYGRVLDSLRVFTGIPFAISGGIRALYLRGMHFSMSAGIGFIALSGVAVLADMVMVQYIRQNLDRGLPVWDAVVDAAVTRLRPVLMTATVASLGFIPMALSTGTGAEVQKPLATVVIGGLITSTLLTLFVLPALYLLVSGRGSRQKGLAAESSGNGKGHEVERELSAPLVGSHQGTAGESVQSSPGDISSLRSGEEPCRDETERRKLGLRQAPVERSNRQQVSQVELMTHEQCGSAALPVEEELL